MRILIFNLIFLLCSAASYAGVMDLEVTNIKTAGTGNPAIPATNRIFRAYPGIEYNIRAAVIGGDYPYTYSLSNAPSGMTINSRTGEISWPNPQANSGTITLSVTDSASASISTQWTITVSTAGFYFIDPAVETSGSGAIDSPFKTINNMLDGVSDSTAIIYFRGGTHNLTGYVGTLNPPDGTEYAAIATSLSLPPTTIYEEPFTWIGYPGETASIVGGGSIVTKSLYFDNLHLSNFLTGHAIRASSETHYKTIRRCAFDNVVAPDGDNNNYSFFFTRESTVGSYLVVQDNTFNNYIGANAIGSIYNSYKAIIENNTAIGESGFNTPLAPKVNVDNFTVRGNIFSSVNTPIIGETNSMLNRSDTVEVSFNFFKATRSPQRAAMVLNTDVYMDAPTTNFYFHRNVLVGDIELNYFDGGNTTQWGVYSFKDNVIINPNANTSAYYAHDYISYDESHGYFATSPWLAITDSGNIKNTSELTVVTTGGLLQPAYNASIGSVGWQFSDGSTPMSPSTPATPQYHNRGSRLN